MSPASSWDFSPQLVSQAILTAQGRMDGFEDPLTGELIASDSRKFVERVLDHLLRESAGRDCPITIDVRPKEFDSLIRNFQTVCSPIQIEQIRLLVMQVLNVNQLLCSYGRDYVTLVLRRPRNKTEYIGYFLNRFCLVFGVLIRADGNRAIATQGIAATV